VAAIFSLVRKIYSLKQCIGIALHKNSGGLQQKLEGLDS